MLTIDLNADLGEGGPNDLELMSFISSVNIACGGHAGDESSMRTTIDAALAAGVAIGAHPGYEDMITFGRSNQEQSADDIHDLVCRQIERILTIHPQLHHVKPHGALYTQANRDQAMAEAIIRAIKQSTPNSLVYCPPKGELARASVAAGLQICPEGFIDRRYLADGNLCPRSDLRGLIDNVDEVISQALKIAFEHAVNTVDGTTIPLQVRTLCVHGDSPEALEMLRGTRNFLEEAGILIASV